MSPRQIAVRARIEKFEDVSPPQDKTAGRFGGLSVTAPEAFAGDLATAVTDAVLTDFDNHAVFAVVKERIDDPDIIINGKIQRFYAKAGPNALFWIDFLAVFGIPTQADEGMVQMELSVRRPDGKLVTTYSGQSKFSHLYTMYSDPISSIGTKLNKAFSEAVSEIRGKILADDRTLTALATQPVEPIEKRKRKEAREAKAPAPVQEAAHPSPARSADPQKARADQF
jgi:hypothetical protein